VTLEKVEGQMPGVNIQISRNCLDCPSVDELEILWNEVVKDPTVGRYYKIRLV